MVKPRVAVGTVRLIDDDCAVYEHLFPEVRSFETFKYLHLGLIAELPRKTLPAIARAVGLSNTQVLPHFLTHSPWNIEAIRRQRLSLILEEIGGQPITKRD